MSEMDDLHRTFQEIIRKELSPVRALTAITLRKLKAKGIRCTAKRCKLIEEQIAEHLGSGADTNRFEIVISVGARTSNVVEIELSSEDFDAYAQDLGKGFGRQMLPMAKQIADLYLSSVRQDDYEGMRDRRAELETFRANLRVRWGKALDSYERLLAASIDFGSMANEYLHRRGEKPSARIDAIAKIHARAAQVAGEILTLLEAGYADGAHARWRTIHELAVVAALLSAHDDELAERYLGHEIVESLKAARQLNDYAAQIGEKPLSKKEFDKLVAMEKILCDRYGTEYGKRYGWASKIVNNPNPNFDCLERAANFNHLRPYYKLASYNVHATPKGANYRLGLLGPSTEMLLAGPSNAGLDDAGRFSGHSLLAITLSFLSIDTTFDSLVYGRMLVDLYQDLDNHFVRAAKQLRADEKRFSVRPVKKRR